MVLLSSQLKRCAFLSEGSFGVEVSSRNGTQKIWGLQWPLRHSNATAPIFSTEVPLDAHHSLLSHS